MGWNIARVQSYIVRGSFYATLPRRRKLPIACGDFFTKVTGALIPLRLLFRKRLRLACLFGYDD